VIEGRARFGVDTDATLGQIVVFGASEGAAAHRESRRREARGDGAGRRARGGPLVFHGPFVMNSVEQVRAAEIAYRTGRMGELAE
jgi:redox-sensitive bicupin YhaK (pirin superfamily)